MNFGNKELDSHPEATKMASSHFLGNAKIVAVFLRHSIFKDFEGVRAQRKGSFSMQILKWLNNNGTGTEFPYSILFTRALKLNNILVIHLKKKNKFEKCV